MSLVLALAKLSIVFIIIIRQNPMRIFVAVPLAFPYELN